MIQTEKKIFWPVAVSLPSEEPEDGVDGLRGGSLLQQFPVLVSSTSRGADNSPVGPDDPVEQLQVGDDAGQGPVVSHMSNASIEKICLYMNEMYETRNCFPP